MKITVRLELTMAKYGPNGEQEATVELPDGARVLTVLEYFRIPETVPKLIVKNGRNAFPEELVSSGDFIRIFPLLEGG